MLKNLWNDEAGIVSIELIVLGSVVGLGILVGAAALRDGINNELGDLSAAIDDINQSFSVAGVLGHSAAVGDSSSIDANDFCDDGATGTSSACITVCGAPTSHDIGTD